MNKMKDKLIAIVLAMTLVLSMSGVAFADVSGAAVNPENAVTQEASAEAASKAVKGLAKTKLMGEDEMDVLSIKTMATSATTAPEYDEWTLEPYSYGLAEVTATTTGWIWLDFVVDGSEGDYINVYTCDTFNEVTGEYTYFEDASGPIMTGTSMENGAAIYAAKGTTYYLYFETPERNTDNIVFSTRAKMYSNLQRTLPVYANANQYMLSSGLNKAGTDYSDIYYKVVPNKTGLMTVNLKSFDTGATTGTVTLYNANKKALSTAVQYSSAKAANKAYFGVVKGKTYYIRVQNCCGTTGKYGVRYSMTAFTDRNIATTAKALQLKKGANVTKTLFTANNSTGTDVYKIYVPKTQTAKFTVNTQNIRSGNITVKVFKNGKQVGTTKTIYPKHISNVYTITYGTASGKASKGTYYIKVTKGAKVSGQYSIKYNK